MAEKKGICRNYVNCSLADKGEEQIVDDINFVCDECHQPLEEVDEKKKSGGIDPNKKKLIILIAAAIVVIGGVIGAFLGIKSGNEKKEAARIEALRIEDSIRQVRETEEQRVSDSLAQIAAAADAERQQQIADSLEQVRITDSIAAAEAEKAAKKNAVKSTSSSIGGSNLGWGNYSGPMQGGKPHGVGGTIKVKSNYSIDLKDGRGTKLQVNPGETIENTKFENGRLRAGELHRSDGSRKWFNC